MADEAENPKLSALLSLRASESSSVRLSGALELWSSGALEHADATRRSHVLDPVATDPHDGLRLPTYEASFEQARMDLNDQSCEKISGSQGRLERNPAAAAILGGHPLRTNS